MCDNPSGYEAVIQKMADFITEELALDGTLVFHLISFNTDSKHRFEDDIIANSEIYNLVPNKERVVLHERLSVSKILELISTMHLGICFRFHSHIFHMMMGIPFLSLCHTRKVQLLMKEHDLVEYQYNLPKVSGSDSIEDADLVQFRHLYQKVMEEYDIFRQKLGNIRTKWENSQEIYRTLIHSWLTADGYPFDGQILKHKIIPPVWKSDDLTPSLDSLGGLLSDIMCYYGGVPKEQNNVRSALAKLLTEGKYTTKELIEICKTISRREFAIDDALIEKVTHGLIKAICFNLTNQFVPIYYFGLSQTLQNDGWDIKEAYKWLLEDWTNNNSIEKKKNFLQGIKAYQRDVNLIVDKRSAIEIDEYRTS